MNDFDKIEYLDSKQRVVYVMRINNVTCYNRPLYKIGVTTVSNGYSRLDTLSKYYSCDYDVIAWLLVCDDAFHVEREVLSIGERLQFMVGKASSEFRAWNPMQLENAKHILQHYSLFHRPKTVV